MDKKKKIVIIVIGVWVVAAVAVMCALLFSAPSAGDTQVSNHSEMTDVQINQINELPMVVYQKTVKQEENRRTYDLIVCQYEGLPQKIVSSVDTFNVSRDGARIAYTLENDNQMRNVLYTIDDNGSVRMVTNEMLYDCYMFADDSETIGFLNYNLNSLCIVRNEAVEQIHVADVAGWQLSADGGIAVYADNYSGYASGNKSWGDLSKWSNGDTEKIAEHVFLPENCMSGDGRSIVYVENYSEGTSTGRLFFKNGENAVELLYERSSMDVEINKQGNFIAAIVSDENGSDALLYKYINEKPVIVNGVSEFIMSGDGTTLVYTIDAKADWDYELYSIRAGEAPVLIVDHVAKTGAVSNDGNTVAYYSNLNKEGWNPDSDMDGWVADLFIYFKGKDKLVDECVATSQYGGSVCLYKDGSVIAYRKNYDREFGIGDLYLKTESGAPQKIDVEVGEGFCFFK